MLRMWELLCPKRADAIRDALLRSTDLQIVTNDGQRFILTPTELQSLLLDTTPPTDVTSPK